MSKTALIGIARNLAPLGRNQTYISLNNKTIDYQIPYIHISPKEIKYIIDKKNTTIKSAKMTN